MESLPDNIFIVLDSLGLQKSSAKWKLAEHGRFITLEVKWTSSSSSSSAGSIRPPKPVVNHHQPSVEPSQRKSADEPEQAKNRSRRRGKGASAKRKSRERLLDYQRKWQDHCQSMGGKAAGARSENPVTPTPAQEPAPTVQVECGRSHVTQVEEQVVTGDNLDSLSERVATRPLTYSQAVQYTPPQLLSQATQYTPSPTTSRISQGTQMSPIIPLGIDVGRPASPMVSSPGSAGYHNDSESDSKLKIYIETSPPIKRHIPLSNPTSCTLEVFFSTPVEFVLADISTLLGLQEIEHQLVLLDFWDGQHWTLHRDSTMDEVVHQSGNTTFTLDITPDH
jgi:hypothetical protein